MIISHPDLLAFHEINMLMIKANRLRLFQNPIILNLSNPHDTLITTEFASFATFRPPEARRRLGAKAYRER